MDKELLIQIYNTLNTVEVKGYDNINKLLGVMMALQKKINESGEKADK